MLEEFVSHKIATAYQPVEVEKFSSRGSDQPRLLESRNFLEFIFHNSTHNKVAQQH